MASGGGDRHVWRACVCVCVCVCPACVWLISVTAVCLQWIDMYMIAFAAVFVNGRCKCLLDDFC